jgi:hypothetical protein
MRYYWRLKMLDWLGLPIDWNQFRPPQPEPQDSVDWKELYNSLAFRHKPDKLTILQRLLEEDVPVVNLVPWIVKNLSFEQVVDPILQTQRYDVILPVLYTLRHYKGGLTLRTDQLLYNPTYPLLTTDCPVEITAVILRIYLEDPHMQFKTDSSAVTFFGSWFARIGWFAGLDAHSDVRSDTQSTNDDYSNTQSILDNTILLEQFADRLITNPVAKHQLQKLQVNAALEHDNVTQFLYYATTLSEIVEKRLANPQLLKPRISQLIVSRMPDVVPRSSVGQGGNIVYRQYIHPVSLVNDTGFYAAIFADPRMLEDRIIPLILKSFSDVSAAIPEVLRLIGVRYYLVLDPRLHLDLPAILQVVEHVPRRLHSRLLSRITDETLHSIPNQTLVRSFATTHPQLASDKLLLQQLLDSGNHLLVALLEDSTTNVSNNLPTVNAYSE